jgi:hypothetical protein
MNEVVQDISGSYQSSEANSSKEIIENNIILFGKDLKVTKSELTAAILLSLYFFLNWSYFSLFA